MITEFRKWLEVTPAERAQIALHDAQGADTTTEPQWAGFGRAVVARMQDDIYQRLITYCLLAGVSPAVVAKIVRDYVLSGRLPWRS